MPAAAGFAENFSLSLSKVWNFFVIGGWFMLPLVVCSLVLIAVIVWKSVDLKVDRIMPADLTARLREAGQLVSSGKFGTLQQAIMHDSSVLALICRSALLSRHPDQSAASRAAEATGREEVASLERGIAVMEIIFTIAPMLGLIGTVSGLVRIFSNFGEERNAAAAQQIAAGIAEAMNTTIAGLAVAVPALIAQVFFSRRVEHYALRMGSLVNNALDAVWQAPAPTR
jgi:biopolymer transport protein ExbB